MSCVTGNIITPTKQKIKIELLIQKKMSYQHLLSPDREVFVYKIYNETTNDASSITNDTYNNGSPNVSEEKFLKNTFLSLVTENDKLLENEKEYCKKTYVYEFELDNALYKKGEPKECNK